MIRLVLFKPEIPQNTGTLLRLAACWGLGVDMIGPYGFIWSERRLRRSGMDYLEQVNVEHYASWETFKAARNPNRLVLLTPHTKHSYVDFSFQPDDCFMVGQESSGVPSNVFTDTDAQIKIPMQPECRSLNVALSAAIVVAEALRQTHQLPGDHS